MPRKNPPANDPPKQPRLEIEWDRSVPVEERPIRESTVREMVFNDHMHYRGVDVIRVRVRMVGRQLIVDHL